MRILLIVFLLISLGGCESMIKKILNNGSNGPAGLPGNVK